MAAHGTVEYATATGNDLPAHERSYVRFVDFAFVGIITVVNILLGLAVGGVMGHWLMALVIWIVTIFGSVPGLITGSKTSSYVSFIICFVIFAFLGVS